MMLTYRYAIWSGGESIKTIIKRVASMSNSTYSIIRGGLLVANAMLFSALIIFFFLNNVTDSARFHYLFNAATSLRELTFAVCFETVFGSAMIEQYVKKKIEK